MCLMFSSSTGRTLCEVRFINFGRAAQLDNPTVENAAPIAAAVPKKPRLVSLLVVI